MTALVRSFARIDDRSLARWARASLARARPGAGLAIPLKILLCLLAPGFLDLRAVAQESLGPARGGMAANATVLTIEQEKARAAEPSSDF